MIKFPYGISDFQRIRTEDYYYVDRTHFIPLIEESGDQILFLRPRRSGKSLLLSILENYYDVAQAKDFERLFGHLAIGKNPTPNHNRYLILRWDFSGIRTDGTAAEIGKRLYSHINVAIERFIEHYRDIIDSETAIERTYADLTMMRRPDLLQHPLLHDLLFEFKYVALGDVKALENKIPDETLADGKLDDEKPKTGKGRAGKQSVKKLSGRAAHQLSDEALNALPEIQAKLNEARTQLQDYQRTLRAYYGERLRLRTYAVVALGFERLVWEAV